MSAKITYLIGAGASAKAIPINKRMENSIQRLTLTEALNEHFEGKKIEMISSIGGHTGFNKMKQLITAAIKFGTPDYLIKFLLESDRKTDYEMMKIILCEYFIDTQRLTPQGSNFFDFYLPYIDRRIIPFLSTIMKSGEVSENVKIISWNYDYQLELASTILSGKNNLFTFTKGFTSWPINRDVSNPFLLHLNGIGGYIGKDDKIEFKKKNIVTDEVMGTPILPAINFAWEHESDDVYFKDRMKIAEKMIQGTEILVVIGYSFPFFNKEVDEKLISLCGNTLQTIYFQDPSNNGDFLINRFKEINENHVNRTASNLRKLIQHITDVDQYHVPYEFKY
jgi:hypothetical protein